MSGRISSFAIQVAVRAAGDAAPRHVPTARPGTAMAKAFADMDRAIAELNCPKRHARRFLSGMPVRQTLDHLASFPCPSRGLAIVAGIKKQIGERTLDSSEGQHVRAAEIVLRWRRLEQRRGPRLVVDNTGAA